jgi:hypothetical protein
MSDDRPLKSAFEIAMERLKEKDRQEGIAESKPLTDAQKEEIAHLRREAKAKLAELEILHRDTLAETGGDPEKIREVEEKYRIDRERVESSLESKIALVREGNSTESD